MKKKILIIGGAGYIGSVLLNYIDQSDDVIVFDSFIFNKINFFKKKYKKIKFIKGNINFDLKKKHFQNIHTVVHLAGLANDPSADYNPNNTVLTNHISTIKIAKFAKEKKVKKLIYASSCSVYGDHGKKLINEKTEERPLTVYALSKFSSESEILKISNNNFKIIALRFATLFGFSQRMRFDLGVNFMTKNILQNKNIIVNGDGKQYRSFVHVNDVAKSIIFFCNYQKKLNYNVYNIGSKKNNITILKLTKIFKKLFKFTKIKKNLQNFDFRSYEVNFDRLSQIYDTQKFISLKEGILEIYQHYQHKKNNLDNKKYYNLKVLKN